MIAFLARHKDYLLATTHLAIMFAVASLLAWVAGGDFYQLLLGMTAFQACLATVRAEK